jgi:transposase
LEWLRGYGELDRVGVEGTGTYGLALTRHLREAGALVVEVDRPDRRARRAQGKSDPLDAYSAARAALSGAASVVPKLCDGRWRRSERFASHDQVRSKPVARPRIRLRPSSSPLREQLRHLPSGMIIAACARLRPGHDLGDAEQAIKTALRRLARRHQQLSEEIAEADHELDQLVHQVAPALLALPGVGPEVAGILAGSWFSSTARRGEDLIAAGLLMLAGPVDLDELDRWMRIGWERRRGADALYGQGFSGT